MAAQKDSEAALMQIPYDLEIELWLIGAATISPTALVSVVDKVKPEHFFSETHRVMFEAITNLHNAGHAVDRQTLKHELRRVGKFDYVGGMGVIRRAMENAPGAANAGSHALIVRELAARRRAMDAADRLMAWSVDRGRSLDETLADTAEMLEDARPTGNGDSEASGRVLLGRGMEDGIEPPEEQEPDVLLRGKVHSIYAAPGTGKTFLSLWLVARAIERGERTLFLDSENGPRIVSERLADLGVNPTKVDEHLFYYPYPSLTLAADDRRRYEALLDRVQPDLVVFDSWLNSLAASGLDENSSNDVAQWATGYMRRARERGITVVVLDHVPHEGDHSRGSTRKKDEVDVMWRLRRCQPFDRGSVGEIALHREKDREGWLPPSVLFSVGGSPGGFVFARSSGTIEERRQPSDLLRTERAALDALRECGVEGASDSQWRQAAEKEPHGVSRATYYRAKKVLLDRERVVAEGGVFRFEGGPPGPENAPTGRARPDDGVSRASETSTTGSSLMRSHGDGNAGNGVPTEETDVSVKRSHGGLTGEMRPDDPQVSQVSPPLKGETVRPGHETPPDTTSDSAADDDLSIRIDELRAEYTRRREKGEPGGGP